MSKLRGFGAIEVTAPRGRVLPERLCFTICIVTLDYLLPFYKQGVVNLPFHDLGQSGVSCALEVNVL